jgi:predicted DNA-binding ribbon-helix-helix protein
MKSTVVKRSIILAGHKTSVSLEDAFWEGLKDIAKTKRKTLSNLVGGIDTDREHANLSSAIRLFVLNHYQRQAARASRIGDIAWRLKIITGELRARPLRSQCCYLRREPGSHRPRCIADSGFGTESDLLLAILTFP